MSLGQPYKSCQLTLRRRRPQGEVAASSAGSLGGPLRGVQVLVLRMNYCLCQGEMVNHGNGAGHSPRASEKPQEFDGKEAVGPWKVLFTSSPFAVWFSKASVSEGSWTQDLRISTKSRYLCPFNSRGTGPREKLTVDIKEKENAIEPIFMLELNLMPQGIVPKDRYLHRYLMCR